MPEPELSSIASTLVDELAWLSALRPDERERAALAFRQLELPPGGALSFPADEPPRMGMILNGSIVLTRAELPGLPPVEIHLEAGDRWGELALFAGIRSGVEVKAPAGARIAFLDSEGFRTISESYPVMWLSISTRLARELKWKTDLLREIQEFDAEKVGAGELDLFLETRRRRVVRRRTGVARHATRAILRTLVINPGREPAFWILLGFVAAIATARATVALILDLHLEHALFNLHDSGGANPTHTHHFNYGFALMIVSALFGFFPRTRQYLRVIAAVFGVGLGLVFDEFALIWNLNPDYYQALSYEAQAVLALLLAQIVWFRRFWSDVFARIGGRP